MRRLAAYIVVAAVAATIVLLAESWVVSSNFQISFDAFVKLFVISLLAGLLADRFTRRRADHG
jgi:hypothetical protein